MVRSVDGDVLLYLCKRLLTIHPTIKIILMSATIHTALYQSYFRTQESDSDEEFYGNSTFSYLKNLCGFHLFTPVFCRGYGMSLSGCASLPTEHPLFRGYNGSNSGEI